ncbi:DNA primase family protein [Rodentibacter haemolyticus]|uniref:DNA primase n=1 Tax=Rodentibacter haemolyticus TaxID=2778911 RepID=A0ABX6V008_9PAST|nr:phage/plasmid primase, P4 family [Rodentibacter haemolyticus]QPB42676.1 DNA primase [Rodentibacter haemolyticus]
MTKLKNAPNLTALSGNDPTELFIFAGTKAWAAWNKGEGVEWHLIADRYQMTADDRKAEPPIILGESQLKEIKGLRLAPAEQEAITLFEFGELSQSEITAICANLAKHTQVQRLTLCDSIGQIKEDLSGYLKRIRTGETLADVVADSIMNVELTAEIINKASINERTDYFIQWYDKQHNTPLAYHPEQGRIYGYNGKCWQYLPEFELYRIIRGFFAHHQAKYSLQHVKNIYDCLMLEVQPMGKSQPHLLAFNNGALNKNTLELLPHNPDDWLTGFNPCDYVLNPPPTPHFNQWLDFISQGNNDRKQSLLAGLYMILFNRNDWQLTLELIGTAGSGKSIYLEVGKLLAGENNHEAITLETLNNEKTRDIILNKTFLYSSDQSRYIGDSSVFKKLSSGESINFDPKHKKAFSSPVKAVLAIASNTLPIYKNDGGGMERRRVIFPFTQAVEESKRDPQLVEKLKSELAGIVHLVIQSFPSADKALQALHRQQHSKEALELKRENDHILDFIQEFELMETVNGAGLIFGSALKMPIGNADRMLDRLYWAYWLYCEHQGIDERQRLKKRHLERELVQAFKTAGNRIDFKTAILAGNRNHTNAIYKDREQTRRKFSD